MKLDITVDSNKPGIVTLLPVGTIDTETSSVLDEEICSVTTETTKTLVLDMAGVEFITSAGVGIIAKAKTSMKQNGADLAMINLQPQVKKVFEIVRLLPVLNVFASKEELDEYLGKVQRRITGEEDEY
jgi:anti-anti-sigma factor